MSAVQTTPAVDAFTAEVIRNAVVAITREMKTNLMRTTVTPSEATIKRVRVKIDKMETLWTHARPGGEKYA